jgi:periplasmic protein TonB
MFKVVAERRKRSVWSSRTVAASVVVHGLLAAGFLTATPDEGPREVVVDIGMIPPEPPKPVVARPTPPAPRPDKPQPTKGQTVQIPAPEKVPEVIPPPNPNDTPLPAEHVTGRGPVGDIFGKPDPDPAPPSGTTEPQPEGTLPRWDAPIAAHEADVQPELTNKRQAEMILQRSYPPLLRDVGATGRTTVMLIIDKDGHVEPGSVQVQESTHDAFKDAAIRAVERFRFRPAKLKGQPVAVLVTLPIEWRLEN